MKSLTYGRSALSALSLCLLVAGAGCTGDGPVTPTGEDTGGGGAGGATSTGSAHEGGSQDDDDGFSLGPTGGGTTKPEKADACDATDDEDRDQDGFSKAEGDCNDCDPNTNPNAIEATDAESGDVVTNEIDENCNGEIDEPLVKCDDQLVFTSTEANDAAKALDICSSGATADNDTPGLISAALVRADGTTELVSSDPDAHLQIGLLKAFGDNVAPRGGERLLALSTGHARAATGDENADAAVTKSKTMTNTGQAPAGFPSAVEGCAVSNKIADDVAFKITLRAPSNAVGFRFEYNFFSFEYPKYVCSKYNDQFVALMSPAPADVADGNIAFDHSKSPVTINFAKEGSLFQVCDPDSPVYNDPLPGKGCELGTDQLVGTGFDLWHQASVSKSGGLVKLEKVQSAGATGWLVSQAPVEGGETITLTLATWDTGDQALDSTVLIDNFRWIAAPGEKVEVVTKPIVTPK